MNKIKKRAEVLVAEIGSTLTKVSAFAGIKGEKPRFLGQGIALTTVAEGDVSIGFEEAKQKLQEAFCVDTSDAELMAAASAAGGLRMTVHGLTRDMTLRAAREAALGAGANLVYTTAGLLLPDDVEEIISSSPNLILLTGGVDFGDRKTVINNAKVISSSDLTVPVIYAGNQSAAGEVKRLFERTGKSLWVVDNVYPRIDELNIKPVRKIIHEVFSKHIVTAPGMKKIKELLSEDLIPTPGAVLAASELLYQELGDLITVDVGGATTDIHSVTKGSPRYKKLQVSPEPLSKRTVEGDLGVYLNADRIIKAAGIRPKDIGDVSPLPEEKEKQERVRHLTRWAVDLAMWRHAGEIKFAYGAYGRNEMVEGRDLTAVRILIGTGGALTRLGGGEKILASIRTDPAKRKLLPPKAASILLDRHYIMASAGVLLKKHPDMALVLLKDSLGLSRSS